MARFSVAVFAFSLLLVSTDASEPKKLRVLCDGDELSQWVKCEDNHGIQVESPKYGREEEIFCTPTNKDANSTRKCGMKDVYDKISPVCDGKQRCDTFFVNTINLGELKQCQNVKKYLIMHFECVRIKDDEKQRRPNVVEASKKKTKTIDIMPDDKARTSTMFEAQHNSSTSTKPVGLFILLVLGTFCILYS